MVGLSIVMIYWVNKFRKVIREVKRLDSTNTSKMLSQITETIKYHFFYFPIKTILTLHFICLERSNCVCEMKHLSMNY